MKSPGQDVVLFKTFGENMPLQQERICSDLFLRCSLKEDVHSPFVKLVSLRRISTILRRIEISRISVSITITSDSTAVQYGIVLVSKVVHRNSHPVPRSSDCRNSTVYLS